MTENSSLEELHELVERFTARAREELSLRWRKWQLDLAQNEFHEVAGALLARQVTLASQLATNPMIWNGQVAPIILRVMADVYITLAWVLRDPLDRSKRFIHYGLGQQKLQLEHRRAELADREPAERELEQLEAIENWINTQRAVFLTNVDLGSWSGISTRSMAEEADCLDFYHDVYAPFSACAHSMWHHVALHNLRQCRNPLHRFHSVPHLPELEFDPQYLYLGADYLQKTFAAFDEAVEISIEGQTAFDLLRQGLEAFNVGESNEETPTT